MDENPMDQASEYAAGVETAEAEDVLLTDKGYKFLNQTRPWARFMSIMVFIGAAFMMLGAATMFVLGLTGNLVGARSEIFRQMPGGILSLGVLYAITGILYIPPGVFLARYATAIKNLESLRTSPALEKALKYQKSFWRYVGILTVIGLIVAAAFIAFSFAVAFFMFINRQS